MDLPQTADVVVVGGGVIGASALYHLARAGCTSAVLIESTGIGAGATGAAAGGVRTQFSDELNIRIGLECIERFERFEEEIGAPISLHQNGYLFLLREEDLPPFDRSLELQRSLGVPVERLSPEQILEVVPNVRVDDLAGANLCRRDGVAAPADVAQGYASAARRLGAKVVEGRTVASVDVEDERIVGVTTDRGAIAAPTVIVAAGYPSVDLLTPLGAELPLRPERRNIYFTDAVEGQPPQLPLTVDFATGFYFHSEGDGLLMGGREPDLESLIPIATNRLPGLEHVGVRTSWAGDYVMSPDHNPVVGPVVDGLDVLVATGFSGHGFQQGPVIGEHLAELALDRETTFDLSEFGYDRFQRGAQRVEHNVI